MLTHLHDHFSQPEVINMQYHRKRASQNTILCTAISDKDFEAAYPTTFKVPYTCRRSSPAVELYYVMKMD